MRRTLSNALLLSLLAAAAPGCWSSEEKAPPALSVSPDHLDFGQAGVGETVHRTVVLTNRGKAPLAVERIGVTSPFEALEASLSLAPGESRSLGVKFSPTESGRAEALLGIESARGVVRVSLRGEAHGVPVLYIDRKRVEFGEVAIGQLSTALVTIENRGRGALRLSKLAVATPFEASLDASEVAPPPFLVPVRMFNSWSIVSVTLTIEVPFFCSIKIYNSRSTFSVTFAIDPPRSVSPTSIFKRWPIYTMECIIG